MSISSQRELPQSSEAEVSVLGAMLLNNNTIDIVIPMVADVCFAGRANREIFKAIRSVHDAGRPVDLVTLREELKQRGKLADVGGPAYLAELIDAVPAAANVAHYANIVREKATSRRVIEAATHIVESAYEDSNDSAHLLDDAQQRIFDIAEGLTKSQAMPLSEVVQKAFKQIQERANRGSNVTGLATHFADLDELTSGLQNSEMIVLASRPSMGKTTLALNMARRMAVREAKPILLFSLEMAREQVASNILCAEARLNSHRLRRGALQTYESTKLSDAKEVLERAPIFIDDTPGITIMEMRAKSRQLRRLEHIELIVVDYMQLMEGPRSENRQQEISAISRGLKGLARDLTIPVLAVSQLNRAVETREGNRPRMADLRESGSIEQDADVVMLLHRPAYYDQEAATDAAGELAELMVVKQRNGPVGTVKLTFLKHQMRFEDQQPGFDSSYASGPE